MAEKKKNPTPRRARAAAPMEPRPAQDNTAPAGPDPALLPARPVGEAELRQALATLKKYKAGKANLEARVIANEQWFKMRHWQQLRGMAQNADDPRPASAWLFNAIANKHADAMDSFPEPNVLPREEGDKAEAEALSSILPVILEQNQFEQVYSDAWWYKLKTGTAVYGVFWNGRKMGGLGDVEIAQLDLLNLFWEPGVRDIQKSRNVFHVELTDTALLRERYPQLEEGDGKGALEVSKYIYDDTVDTTEKTPVIDWYYKREGAGGDTLHYCKFVGDTLLYASENDPLYAERGYYDHGKYPFVFDTLFLTEGTPTGFGYIDIMKDPQSYIDRLSGILLKNAVMAGKKRFFIRDDGSVNEQEFADWNRDFIHVAGGGLGDDSIRELSTDPAPGSYLSLIQLKVDEMKETSGNRDFNQGGTNSGVTAASAIAALQEAGSKLSRDMIKSSYRAFTQINYLCIELIRQFYTVPRCFRILGKNGELLFRSYDNTGLRPMPQGEAFGVDLGVRKPVFDITVVSQKSSPFSKLAQNEFAKELYGLGFFKPEQATEALAAVDMMDFEGKEAVLRSIYENKQRAEAAAAQQQAMQAQLAAGAAQRLPSGYPTHEVSGAAQRQAMQAAIQAQRLPKGAAAPAGRPR